jgi:phospholipid/cholesterol/gamma-HCH transport system substrate-binding protein
MKADYLKLGIFVVIGLALLATGIFLISKERFPFGNWFEVETRLNNAGGLRKGAPVRVAGIEKGVVEKLILPTVPNGQARVIMKLNADARGIIGPDAYAQIKTQGFFGEPYMEIVLGNEPVTPEMANCKYIVIPGKEENDLNAMIEKATHALGEIEQTSAQFHSIANKLNEGEGTIGMLINDKQLYRNFSAASQSLQTAAGQLQQIVGQVRSGKGALGNLVYGHELTPEISTTLADARQSMQKLTDLLNKVENGHGTMSKLINDEAMASDLQATLRSTRAATENIDRLLSGIEDGKGSLGVLVKGNIKLQNHLGDTLKAAHNAIVHMNEVLDAAKTNSLISGYFVERGYWSVTDIEANQLVEPVNGKIIKEYSFYTNEFFDNKNYSARLQKTDPLYAIGVYLMNQSYSIVAIRVYLSEVGDAKENKELSQARAYAIREYLTKNFPVDENKIKIKGYGEVKNLPVPPERGAGIIHISVYE